MGARETEEIYFLAVRFIPRLSSRKIGKREAAKYIVHFKKKKQAIYKNRGLLTNNLTNSKFIHSQLLFH